MWARSSLADRAAGEKPGKGPSGGAPAVPARRSGPLPLPGRVIDTGAVDRLRLAYLALALGLMGFGALWSWLALRRTPGPLPRVPRRLALLLLLLAVGGLVAALLLQPPAGLP